MTGVRLSMATAGVILLAAAAPLLAQDEPFRKGMDARGDQKWPEVAARMQEAIRADRTESTRKIGGKFGIGGDEYLPYFYLGEALQRQNDCAGALIAWDESERQGVIRRYSRNLGVLRKGVAECEGRGFLAAAKLQEEQARAAEAIRSAAVAEQELAGVRAAHADAATPESRASADRAVENLRRARERLEAVRSTRRSDDITQAVSSAGAARKEFVAARSLLDRNAAASAQAASQLDEIDRTLANADRTVQSVAALLDASPVKLAPSSSLVDARKKAVAALAAAREKVSAARRSRADADVAEARRSALAADAALSKVQADADALRASAVASELRSLTASAGARFAALGARIAEARSASPGTAGGPARTAPELTKIEAELAAGRRRFDKAAADRDLVAARRAAAAVAELDRRLDALAAGAPNVDRPPQIPDALRGAAQAFLDGRYQSVIDALTEDAAEAWPPSLQAHAHVLKAASWLALYEYSGRRDDGLRAAAQREVGASRRLDPAFEPNPAAFSPKFLAFFKAD